MGDNRLIFIRTDANSNISAGHLVRCLSVAEACRGLGMKVHFLLSDEESRNDSLHGFSVSVIPHGNYCCLDQELATLPALLEEILKQEECPLHKAVFLLDSYFVTSTYLKTVNALIKTAYLDDLQLFDYGVDLIINYDVIPSGRKYAAYQSAYRQCKKTLLGPSYTPLREQFHHTAYTPNQQVKNILITTGASDPYHLCLSIAQRFSRQKERSESPFKDKILHILAGSYNQDKEALLKLSQNVSDIQFHENIQDMADLMCHCDLALSSSGTTLYELCAVGVPTAGFIMADNQLKAAAAFAETGIIPCLGDIRTEKEAVLDKIFCFISEMSQNFNKRKSAHDAMRRLIDGGGSQRIAHELQQL